MLFATTSWDASDPDACAGRAREKEMVALAETEPFGTPVQFAKCVEAGLVEGRGRAIPPVSSTAGPTDVGLPRRCASTAAL